MDYTSGSTVKYCQYPANAAAYSFVILHYDYAPV